MSTGLSSSRPSNQSPTAPNAPQPASSSACAACKYQRRKCTPDCTLAPFFPAERQRQFLNVHRLFGVSNVLKILRSVDPAQRRDAMNSIIFQSNARAHDPAGGCYRIVLDLQRQIDAAHSELQYVLRQLAFLRSSRQPTSDGAQPNAGGFLCFDSQPNFSLGDGRADAALLAADPLYAPLFGNGNNSNDDDHDDGDDGRAHLEDFNGIGGCTAEPYPMLSLQHETAAPVDADAVFSNAHYCSTRLESRGKEDARLIERMQEHDLKGAASLFTLTNYNTSAV